MKGCDITDMFNERVQWHLHSEARDPDSVLMQCLPVINYNGGAGSFKKYQFW